MSGAYLPPVLQELTLNIDDYLAKIEEAKAAQDDLAAHTAEQNEAMKAGGAGPGGPGGQPQTLSQAVEGRRVTDAQAESMRGLGQDTERAAADTERLDKGLGEVRQVVHGTLPTGVMSLGSAFQALAASMQSVGGGFGKIFSGFGSLGGIWSQPLSMLSSLVSFGKTWAIMVPTLFAAPALLAAIGGAAGGLAGSFTVLSTAIGLFAMGAMKDLSYVTSVSNMAQFDALSAPLQSLYYAYHNLSNEFTIMTQTMGGNNTIISVLTGMFNTMAVVLQRIGPLMGEVASAGQAAFNILSGSLLGPQFTQFVAWIGSEATPVLTTFSQTFVNLASGWAGLMEDLTPAITLFDQGMVHLTATFSQWANSPKGQAGVEGFVAYVQRAWPEIMKFWEGLGHIFYEFFSSAAKGAPGMAADLGNLFTTIGNAMPSLVQFGDQVLPKIVSGFAQLTGGFVQGFGESLKGISGAMKGIDWHGVGVTMGKIAADLVEMLPQMITVLGYVTDLIGAIGRLPAWAIWALVGAWVAFKGVLAISTIVKGIGMVWTGITGLGGAIGTLATRFGSAIGGMVGDLTGLGGAATATEADVAGIGVAADTAATGGIAAMAVSLAPLAAVLAPIAAVLGLAMAGKQTPVAQHGYVGGRAGLGFDLGHYQGHLGDLFGGQAGAAAARAGNQQINVQAPMTVTVQGSADQHTVQQIQSLLDQHTRQLVTQLVQLRGAYG